MMQLQIDSITGTQKLQVWPESQMLIGLVRQTVKAAICSVGHKQTASHFIVIKIH